MQTGNSGWVPLEHPQGFVNCNMPLPQIEAKHREECVNPGVVVGGGHKTSLLGSSTGTAPAPAAPCGRHFPETVHPCLTQELSPDLIPQPRAGRGTVGLTGRTEAVDLDRAPTPTRNFV